MEREKINWKEIIKEGNLVKVRRWDDMIKEFGVSFDGSTINCFLKFTENMKKYCGENLRINKDMEKDFSFHEVFYYEGHLFSADMLEPYIVPEKKEEEMEIKEDTFMEREKINWREVIKEGNLVRFRQWNDMAEEFGVYYEHGNPFCEPHKAIINCSKLFPEKMKKYCGEIIKINLTMEIEFNLNGFFHYESYSISTDMLEPYAVYEEEKKEEKEIITPNIENHGIKENAIYVIEYNDGAGKTFLSENNFITFKGKIINFTDDKCFIVDQEKGLAILPVKNIISMIPVKIREKN